MIYCIMEITRESSNIFHTAHLLQCHHLCQIRTMARVLSWIFMCQISLSDIKIALKDMLANVQSDFFRRSSDIERWNVDELTSNADVALADQDTGVVDGLGQSELEDLGLEAPLQEVLHFETQDEIELHLGLVQHSDPDKTTQESIA